MKLEPLLNPLLSSVWGLPSVQFPPLCLLSETFCLQLYEFGKWSSLKPVNALDNEFVGFNEDCDKMHGVYIIKLVGDDYILSFIFLFLASFDIFSSFNVFGVLYFHITKCFVHYNKLICSWWELSWKQEEWEGVKII
jgi:hypothetical protein